MGRFHGMDLTLVKPLTWMNDSGLAVRKVLARQHAPLVDLLVVTDDFSLPFGKLRFREGGGPGGHNGLRSIIDELGTEKFSRLRVGIGAPGSRLQGPRPQRISSRPSGSGSTSCSTPGPTRSRNGPATGRRRRRTASTCSSSGRPTRRGSPRRARSRGRPIPTGSAGRGPAGGGCCRGGTTRDLLDGLRDARAAGTRPADRRGRGAVTGEWRGTRDRRPPPARPERAAAAARRDRVARLAPRTAGRRRAATSG